MHIFFTENQPYQQILDVFSLGLFLICLGRRKLSAIQDPVIDLLL